MGTGGSRNSKGTSTPPFNKDDNYTHGGHHTFTGGLTGANTSGNVWYVDSTNGNTTNNGKGWNDAFSTITLAVAAAGARDVIYVAQGDYDEGAAIAITQESLKIIGPGIDNQHNALILGSAASHTLMTINAHNVEIAGIGFTQTKDTYNAIMISTTASFHKTHIHHCRFDGYGQGEYAIHTGSTYDTPDVVIEDCVIRSWMTAGIYANATRGIYRNSRIIASASTSGIVLIPTTTSRPDTLIENNTITGTAANSVGIEIANTPGAGTYLMVRNLIANCSTTITGAATNDAACILNYTGDANGGVLIDPSP